MIRMCFVIAVACTLAACATRGGVECRVGERASVVDTLYFGTSRPQGVVSDSEWREFLASVVTPRFPDGLTVTPAEGQWRGRDGAIVHEKSHVLALVHAEDDESMTAVSEIIRAYRTRFEQESVMRTTMHTCASF